MNLEALSCPQCGAALSRMARWRKVACPFCQAIVGQGGALVERARFRAAWERARPAEGLPLAGERYQLLHPLGGGRHAEVWLAERLGCARERVTLKLAWPDGAAALAREAEVLKALHGMDGVSARSAAFLLWRVPQVRATGTSDGRHTLALSHPNGFWGSLQDAAGQEALHDPRHLVWLWGRVLEQLDALHGLGFTHGDLHAAHWLIHPGDHGVQLCGWSSARRGGDVQADLQQTAATLRQAFAESPLPAPLSGLLEAVLRGEPGSAGHWREALRSAAREAFGPPQFIPFVLRS